MGGNLNKGKEWSELELVDLRNSLSLGDSLEEIADFLCRGVDEVRKKAAEIGAIGGHKQTSVGRRSR